MPGLVEFQKYFDQFNPEVAAGIADRWFAMPTYVQLDRVVLNRVESLVELRGVVEEFVEHHWQAVNLLTKARRHFEALDFINERLNIAEREFSGDDLITARVYTYRGRGFIQEHLATFGDYSKLELGNTMRTTAFLSAAQDYILADLELGCVTDYGARISECYGGAQINRGVRMAVLAKLFGSTDRVTLVDKNSIDMILVQDLFRRAVDQRDAGEVPGGGQIKIVSINQPDSRVN